MVVTLLQPCLVVVTLLLACIIFVLLFERCAQPCEGISCTTLHDDCKIVVIIVNCIPLANIILTHKVILIIGIEWSCTFYLM